MERTHISMPIAAKIYTTHSAHNITNSKPVCIWIAKKKSHFPQKGYTRKIVNCAANELKSITYPKQSVLYTFA